MRLGFHYHVPAMLDGGQIRMPAYQGRFVDALADYCSEVICFLHSPLPSEQAQMDYAIQRRNVRLVGLGPHASVPRRLLSVRKYGAILRKEKSGLDALLLRGPSPLLPTLADAASPVPTALLLVGDAVAGVDDSRQPCWRREAIRLLWQWNRRRQDQVAKRSLTFVNSRKLFRELQPTIPNLVETRTTTLTRADFFDREDTCIRAPYRLLYTGRMTRGKGLIEMVEALALLVQQGEDVVLDLVGWPEKGDDVLDEMQQVAGRLQVGERVKFHGPKAAGPELFAHYRKSDIYVIASKSDFEGFPRTIWEAMAHSLPVVATRVGSIPDSVGESAELVIPASSDELAKAIRRVIKDRIRRRGMIQKGKALALDSTLETQVGNLIRDVERWARRPR
ncbi:MAG: glycosyltransferase family 4 protein [Verrucomicrobia bacterium]|nr:glycosyltransferase family 4 protein [Verrucomicrobiota bacterium]